MKQYLLVYEPNTSSYHQIQPICDLFDNVNYSGSDKLNQIDHDFYHRIIFCFRKELRMWCKLKNKPLNDEKYIFTSSDIGGYFPFKTASPGFTEYKNSTHKYFLPICSILYKDIVPLKDRETAMGFYINKQIYDEYEKEELRKIMTEERLKTYELGVDFVDKTEFFNSITHFNYYSPKKLDNLPNILVEAMSSGTKVLMSGNSLNGGLIDLNSAYKKGNITFEVYYAIWKKLIDAEFEFEFDKTKYETFNDWIEEEIL